MGGKIHIEIKTKNEYFYTHLQTNTHNYAQLAGQEGKTVVQISSTKQGNGDICLRSYPYVTFVEHLHIYITWFTDRRCFLSLLIPPKAIRSTPVVTCVVDSIVLVKRDATHAANCSQPFPNSLKYGPNPHRRIPICIPQFTDNLL